jgi:hypothetical protein
MQSKENVENNNKQPEDDFYATTEKKVDLTLFGFNFTKIDKFTKYAIGITFIVVVFSAVIYGLMVIRNMNKKEVKNKKVKKTN